MARKEKIVMYKGKLVRSVDLTPTWVAVLPIYLECIQEAAREGDMSKAEAALGEIKRMAAKLDDWNEYAKQPHHQIPFHDAKRMLIDTLTKNEVDIDGEDVIAITSAKTFDELRKAVSLNGGLNPGFTAVLLMKALIETPNTEDNAQQETEGTESK